MQKQRNTKVWTAGAGIQLSSCVNIQHFQRVGGADQRADALPAAMAAKQKFRFLEVGLSISCLSAASCRTTTTTTENHHYDPHLKPRPDSSASALKVCHVSDSLRWCSSRLRAVLHDAPFSCQVGTSRAESHYSMATIMYSVKCSFAKDSWCKMGRR